MYLDMPTCVSIMANNELEELETILCKKYKKFKWIYRVISQYHENLDSIEYQKDTDDSELIIYLNFSEETDIPSVEERLSSVFQSASEKYPDGDCKWMTDGSHVTVFLSLNEI